MPVKWNDKDMEARYLPTLQSPYQQNAKRKKLHSYKFGAVACGVGSMICDKTGHPLGKDILQGGAYCCSAAAAAVTASQAPTFIAAANKIGGAAVVGKNGVIAGGKLVGQCVSGVCKVAYKKVTGHRSIDGEILEREVREDEVDGELVARFEERKEFDEDDALVARFVDSEQESDGDSFE